MELKQILEAIVFSAQKPMSIGELRTLLRDTPEKLPDEPQTGEYAKATARAVEKALEELTVEHDAVNRSYRLACVGGNWQFVTKPDFAPWLQVLVGAKPRPPKLSHPALETLAIIAYRQPITRAEIEQIRGVAVDGVVQTLIERELIEVCGEADAPGRPRLHGTTQFFLEHFGLKGLDELPAADELRRIHVKLATTPADDSQEELPLDNGADEDDDDSDKVDSDKVDSDKVDSDKVDSDKVDSDKVDSGEVDSDEVDSDEVDSDEVDSDEVDSDEVDSDEVDSDDDDSDDDDSDEVEGGK